MCLRQGFQRRVLRMDYRRYGLSLLFERHSAQPNALVVIDGDGRRTVFVTTKSRRIRSIQIGG
ncbi:MAG TPA: hypothetical protein VNT03_08465 [Baekduia sp.]|nr:hypothetical protein [Baekduia sp.]